MRSLQPSCIREVALKSTWTCMYAKAEVSRFTVALGGEGEFSLLEKLVQNVSWEAGILSC